MTRPPTIRRSGVRRGTQQITVGRTTEVRWFSVDVAGNVERSSRRERVEVRGDR
ncbi:hypothetical protein [Streptosporangium carneum]|uniref:Uncharacterized protein n=1 Tax=Streptosporangium carneum TaxID=47481 RepID=A0A9W6I091_9ACTN|nr:hypothetical protein [Streptosporangium carneum]GLK08644.1 hypothetical protein GCM10017600_20490 [Streptosporangium carneum]